MEASKKRVRIHRVAALGVPEFSPTGILVCGRVWVVRRTGLAVYEAIKIRSLLRSAACHKANSM